MLDDSEMLGRLAHLYGPERADAIGRGWEILRGNGLGHLVDKSPNEMATNRRMKPQQIAERLT